MTLSLIANKPVGVTAYRKEASNPESGFILGVGSEHVVLTEKEADELGRYLLFQKPEPDSKEPLNLVEDDPQA